MSTGYSVRYPDAAVETIVSDYLYARHRIVVKGVAVGCAIDEAKKIVWLMGIRTA